MFGVPLMKLVFKCDKHNYKFNIGIYISQKRCILYELKKNLTFFKRAFSLII